ncbi:MAG: hypothetical protein AB7V27_11415 [Candidatus Binatia bacterium]
MSRVAAALVTAATAASMWAMPAESGAQATPTPTATVSPAACLGDCDGNGAVAVNELVLAVNIVLEVAEPSACSSYPPPVTVSSLVTAVNNLLRGCGGATPTPGAGLGVRRVSLDARSSHIRSLLNPQLPVFTFFGFTGFLELTAGEVDPQTGLAYIDVTDASEYLAIDIPSITTAFCIAVPRDALPVERAGFVSCNGGFPAGFELVLDHNLGVVGACSGGSRNGLTCAGDDNCPNGVCFNAERCAAAGGTVEGPTAPHPGVCNGVFQPTLLPADSGPGAVLISPDPENGLINGLPAEIVTERALPCGDEPNAPGLSVVLALTSDWVRCEILDANDQAGMTLADERDGENFSCDAWTTEDGPGVLQFCAPVLHQVVAGIPQPVDLVTTFVFDDKL